MKSEVDRIDVAELVGNSIAEALMVPRESVVPAARLISDLDAESIDIVDIRFRIEEVIGFKIDQDAMTKSLGENLTPERFDSLFTVQFITDHVQKLLDQRKE